MIFNSKFFLNDSVLFPSCYFDVISGCYRYGAIIMDDQYDDGSLGYTVLHNSSCQHAGPTFINLMNAAILRLASHNKNMTIRTRNHPLPMTKSQHLQRHVCYPFCSSTVQALYHGRSSKNSCIIKLSLVVHLGSDMFLKIFIVFLHYHSFSCFNILILISKRNI